MVRSLLGYTVVCPCALTAAISVARMSPLGPPSTVAVSFDVGREMTAAPLVNQTYLTEYQQVLEKRRVFWIVGIHPFDRENRGNSLYHRRIVQPAIELRGDIEIIDGARIPRVADQGALDARGAGDGQSCYGPAFDYRFVPAVAGQCSDIQTRRCEFVDRFLRMLGNSGSETESCEKEDGGGIHSRIGWPS